MEILSIGEKIKRSRIYKGYTLKDICGEKISVSKMSCIENDKIAPDTWVLELVANTLEIDIDYLKKDVREQLEYNLDRLKLDYNKADRGDALKYNLEYAEKYKYYNIAFEFMHMLFNYYLDIKDMNSCQINTSRLYNLCGKSCNEKNKLIYYMDIGRYFYNGNEYFQAASYYNNVMNTLSENKCEDYNFLSNVIYEEANCHFMLKNYEKAYQILLGIIEMIDFINDGEYKARIFNLLGILCIKMDNGQFEDFEKKSYELCENNKTLKAEIIFRYGSAMLETDVSNKAYEYINKSVSLYPMKVNRKYVDFMLNVTETLIEVNKTLQALEICDRALNYSIDLNENVFIEKSYHFKALIMFKEKKFEMSEMYMNLSLDILVKLGNKNEIQKRYMEMGNLYFEENNASESLKYFNLAINLNKII